MTLPEGRVIVALSSHTYLFRHPDEMELTHSARRLEEGPLKIFAQILDFVAARVGRVNFKK